MDRWHVRPRDPGSARLPFVGVEHIGSDNGVIDFDSDSRVGNQENATYGFDTHHVLYGKLRPYLNKVATPDFSGKSSTELVPLLPRDGVDLDFLAHLLRRRETVDFVMASVNGSRMPRVDMKVLLSMRVPLPPLDEQQRMVGILNRAARIERLRMQAQERLREFIPALFVRMFGDPINNPMGWTIESLGKLIEKRPQNGIYRPKPDYGSGTLILRMDGFHGGEVTDPATSMAPCTLGPIHLARYALAEGDIIMNRVNSHPFPGKSAMVPAFSEPAVFESNMMRFRVDEGRLLPSCLNAMLQLESVRTEPCRNAKDTINQSSINQPDVCRLGIALPPLFLQRRHMQVVNAAKRAAAVVERGCRAAPNLNASLISRLLDNTA